jgi:xanthine dehydrogenase YagS FAD-binding subunit
MNAFEYANPATVEEALGLLAGSWGETEVLAGGTDLISLLKQGIAQPRLVVSLKNVKGLSGIETKGGAIRIGATTKLKDFIANKDVQSNFPGLVTAARNIASQQMINMGTVGGEILQRPRCWYYRNGLGLLGMKDGKSLIETGENRYHAIFGNSGAAKFVHASSLAPGLVALGATLQLQGPKGARSVAAGEFFAAPKSETDRESVLAPNEILTAIEIPAAGLKNGVFEVRQRKGLDWPMVAAFVAFKDNGGKAQDARIVLGHVAPTPWHSKKGSAALEGQAVTAESLDKAAATALADATPLSGNKYKVPQAKVAIRRAGLAALG